MKPPRPPSVAGGSRLPVWLRYVLIQLPELALLAIPLYLAAAAGWLAPRTAWLLAGLWVLKDALFYPLYRHALRDPPPIGAAALVGECAEVVRELAPVGQVRLRGERWRARAADGRPIPLGARVTVRGHRGLTLLVEPAPGEDSRLPG